MTGAETTAPDDPRALRFSWAEFSGSLGDLGLFLPLVVAVTTSCRLDLGVVLIAAGAMNIVTGWVFRQPIPVQPMKAIAAVAITEGLTTGELKATGLIMGAILLAVGVLGLVDHLQRVVPKAVVRGVQLGVGLKLAAKGAEWVVDLPAFGYDSIFVAALTAAVLLFFLGGRFPGLLLVFVAGFVIVGFEAPGVMSDLGPAWPTLEASLPATGDWGAGFLRGVLPQLPLTLLNSVIAICLLSGDYFPRNAIPPRSMAASVGLINLACCPFGAIPMCHGAGGLAAQYHFGARTGGSVMMLGALKVAAALALGTTLLQVLDAYPLAILGTMLVFAGIQLARAGKDVEGGVPLTVALATAACILGANTWVGFVVGIALHAGAAVRARLART